MVNKIDVINLIGALADVEKTRNDLVHRNVIASCVRLLKDPSTPSDVQGSTLEVLAKLAIEKTETQFAIEQQALGTVFDLLASVSSTDVQCQLLVRAALWSVLSAVACLTAHDMLAPAVGARIQQPPSARANSQGREARDDHSVLLFAKLPDSRVRRARAAHVHRQRPQEQGGGAQVRRGRGTRRLAAVAGRNGRQVGCARHFRAVARRDQGLRTAARMHTAGTDPPARHRSQRASFARQACCLCS